MSNLQRPKVIKVIIPIPKDKVGLVIGRKGWRLQEIRDQTGVQIFIKDNRAHLRGTAEQCQNAEKVIVEILKVRTDVHNQECLSLSLGQSTIKPVGEWLAYTDYFCAQNVQSKIDIVQQCLFLKRRGLTQYPLQELCHLASFEEILKVSTG